MNLDDFYKEILEYWDSDHLARWTHDELNKTDVSNSSKTFLKNVGLPLLDRWTMRFGGIAQNLVKMSSYQDVFPGKKICDLDNMPLHCEKLTGDMTEKIMQSWIVGFDYVNPICIKPDNSVQIVTVDGLTETLCNTSIEKLGISLHLYQKLRDEIKEADEVGKLFEKKLRKLDTTIFTDENSLWSTIIEELGYGL